MEPTEPRREGWRGRENKEERMKRDWNILWIKIELETDSEPCPPLSHLILPLSFPPFHTSHCRFTKIAMTVHFIRSYTYEIRSTTLVNLMYKCRFLVFTCISFVAGSEDALQYLQSRWVFISVFELRGHFIDLWVKSLTGISLTLQTRQGVFC